MQSGFGRVAGVLLHVTSLPGDGPLGNMGPEARRFIDFLQQSGQRIWQILPLTPPSRGNSPYSSYSVFAGNPLLISPEDLEADGLIAGGSCASLYTNGPYPRGKADFEAAERLLIPLLRSCWREHSQALEAEAADFYREQSYWLEDYALFMALRGKFGGISHREWPRPLLFLEPAALQAAAAELEDEISFWRFTQYLFFRQWTALRRYAGERGVAVMGDAPIYVDRESADVWANPSVFQLDEQRGLTMVSGVPPDAFSAEGQLWDNPLYDWDALKASGYDWWLKRLKTAALMYDAVRIDHFRALQSYWAIPSSSNTARIGSWMPGPGMDFLNAVKNAIPDCRLVAEDLGIIGDDVRELLEQSGLPGLTVLLFAFDPSANSIYLPHNTRKNRIGYIGTHDNDTAIGWLNSAPEWESSFARDYMHLTPQEGESWGMIRTLYSSVADVAVVQAQDLLGLGSQARMNIPAQVEGNWGWRLEPGQLTPEISERLAKIVRLYSR